MEVISDAATLEDEIHTEWLSFIVEKIAEMVMKANTNPDGTPREEEGLPFEPLTKREKVIIGCTVCMVDAYNDNWPHYLQRRLKELGNAGESPN